MKFKNTRHIVLLIILVLLLFWGCSSREAKLTSKSWVLDSSDMVILKFTPDFRVFNLNDHDNTFLYWKLKNDDLVLSDDKKKINIKIIDLQSEHLVFEQENKKLSFHPATPSELIVSDWKGSNYGKMITFRFRKDSTGRFREGDNTGSEWFPFNYELKDDLVKITYYNGNRQIFRIYYSLYQKQLELTSENGPKYILLR